MPEHQESTVQPPGDEKRRAAVLDAALRTFARFGYRKTSMDEVAADARISRPGLYFLFSSKSALFREAMERAIELDLVAATAALADRDRPLRDRVLEAFDCWAGRYVGPLADVPGLLESSPDLLGPLALAGPARFEYLLDDAIAGTASSGRAAVVQTLLSVSIGLKHQVDRRDEYLARMGAAVTLILGEP